MERSLSRRLSLCPSPLPRFEQRCFCTSRTMGESISTIQRSPRISTSYKFSAPRCRLPPMALQTVQVSVEPRLSTALNWRSLSRAVKYGSQSLRYHASNSVVFLHRAGTLAKEYPLSKLFSKVEPWPFEKEININVVYSSCLKHANEMLLGDPRQSDQRTQSFHFPIVVYQSLDPAAQSSAQAPSSLSSHALRSSSARQAQNASTRVGSTRRRGNHMHDHSRFQRDINDVTGVSLSLSLPLTKVTDAQYRKRFRASYNIEHSAEVPTRARRWGLCALRHGIQISMEAILACHPARSTEWLDCHTKSCELCIWRVRTGPIATLTWLWCTDPRKGSLEKRTIALGRFVMRLMPEVRMVFQWCFERLSACFHIFNE